MQSEPVSTKLLSQYETIRRQEHDEITALLDTLGRVDDLPDAQMEQVRDALFHANHPFLMVLVGPFGSGKSSVINALLGEELLEVGPIPTTDHIVILRAGPDMQRSRAGDVETVFHPQPLLKNLSLVDTPGLESVFRTHDQVTRRFLHRADVVLLVMIATQVLTASNLEYLQELKVYGKRVLVVVNQIDVLDDEEREQVREFVVEQCRQHLGIDPKVWLVSAKQALVAQQEDPRDEILWDESGFADIEEYIQETLGDAERIRQKLVTPVQISQNVSASALTLVQERQSALDEHRKTLENIDAQIQHAREEQEHTIEGALDDIGDQWDEVTKRGGEAISDQFQFSRGFSLIFSGLSELVGIGRLFRRYRGKSRTESLFETYKVRSALDLIPTSVEKLGPRLEGRDVQDIDDLVDYTRQAVKQLPPSLSEKVIGKIQTPMRYDRRFLREASTPLDNIVREAGRFETERIDRTLRSTLLILALWEVLVVLLVLIMAFSGLASASPDVGTIVLVFGLGIALALFGLAIIPIRGWFLRKAYERRLREQKAEYLDTLRRATSELVAHGIQLRRDATGPFTRLIESQSELLEEVRLALQNHQQALLRIEGGLAGMAKTSPDSTKGQD